METPDASSWIRTDGDPTLSLAMIIKNEIETLGYCLRTARPHVDEIVVVDTGSTDGSRAVARKYADVYDEIEWPGSFAEARNHSYDLATRDYILCLDGDEYIGNPLHWELIRRSIATPDIILFQLRLHNLLPENGFLQASTIWHERIVLNHPEIRWEGKVHNQIARSARRFMRRTDTKAMRIPARIVHEGYALPQEKKEEKYRVRLPMLREEHENPRSAVTRAYYGFQLALVYLVLKRFDEACTIFETLDYDLLNDENGFYAHYLASKSFLNNNQPEKTLQHCEAMFRITREEPISYFMLAHALLHTGQPYEGILALIEAFQINERERAKARFLLNEEHLIQSIREVLAQANPNRNAQKLLHAYIKQEASMDGLEKLLDVLDDKPAAEQSSPK
jgi:glycosyltransferase involved in cell wall biosynthesis